MAYAHGTTSTLKPNSSCIILRFGSHNLRPQSVPFVRRYCGLSASLEISYGARLLKACPATNNVYKSHLVDSFAPSVDDETNLAFIGTGLHNLGYTVVSKGETAIALEKAGVPVTKPERSGDEKHHIDKRRSGGAFDVVVVNSYPNYDGESISTMVERLTKLGALDEVEEYDLVVVDPQDYGAVLAYLEQNLEDPKFRNILALKSRHHGYDIAPRRLCSDDKPRFDHVVPLSLGGGMTSAIQHHGKEMSFKDYLRADTAWNCVSDFFDPTCVVVKDSIPCSVVSRDDILEAFKLAINLDGYGNGGIVAFNVEVDEALASQILEVSCKMVVARGYTQKGLDVLRRNSKNVIVVEAKKPKRGQRYLRQITGGWHPLDNEFRVASDRNPTKVEFDDVKFAWVCGAHAGRNAIVLVKDKCMLSTESGSSNLLENLRSAMIKAGDVTKGAILATNAIFPSRWKEVVEEACMGGVSVIVEYGEVEVMKPEDTLSRCNNYGVSLLYTHVFKLPSN